MSAKLHGQHCYQDDTLVCGWPEFHRCYECSRIVKPGWAVCEEHADKLEARWERVIASDEPQAEVTAA
jgi:hypothetical protein